MIPLVKYTVKWCFCCINGNMILYFVNKILFLLCNFFHHIYTIKSYLCCLIYFTPLVNNKNMISLNYWGVKLYFSCFIFLSLLNKNIILLRMITFLYIISYLNTTKTSQWLLMAWGGVDLSRGEVVGATQVMTAGVHDCDGGRHRSAPQC